MRRKLIPYNLNLTPVCPLSCRWRSDWHPCHPSLTIGGIRDHRFQFCTLLADQRPRMRLATGNIRNCAIHAAAMVIVPKLEAILSPPVQCSFSAKARSSNRATSAHRAVRTINITKRVLISPERSVSTSVIVADRRFHSHRKRKTGSDPNEFPQREGKLTVSKTANRI